MEKEVTHKIDNKAQINFSIRLADKIYFVAVDTIAFMYLEDETVYLTDFKGTQHIVSKTLESIEKAVPSQQFYRINRQMIVNRQAIKEVATYTNQRVAVHLTIPSPNKTIVPRLKVKSFLSWIEKG